jgi:hypothetical protein
MNTIVLVATLVVIPVSTMAQTTNDTLAQRVQRLEDSAALKRLVDTFSNLADQKDVQKQVLLFTEDATVESITDRKPSSALKGGMSRPLLKFLAARVTTTRPDDPLLQ